jgi:hypothetical protein
VLLLRLPRGKPSVAFARSARSAWHSALGLITMPGVADRANDPLRHSDQALLVTLTAVFDTPRTKRKPGSRKQGRRTTS